MVPKLPSSFNVTNQLLKKIESEVNALYPITSQLKYQIVDLGQGTACLPIVFNKEDRKRLHSYLYLHAIPLLECANLLTDDSFEDAWYWATIQLSFDLHLRYIDYVIDHDRDNTPQLARTAQKYFVRGYTLLRQRNYDWNSKHWAIYDQYLDYEVEAQAHFFHDFSSHWRRVSPLCLIGETYLKPIIQIPNYTWCQRDYFSFLLLDSDCHDAGYDLANKINTPVTYLVNEANLVKKQAVKSLPKILDQLSVLLKREATRLQARLRGKAPAWQAIIQALTENMNYYELPERFKEIN